MNNLVHEDLSRAEEVKGGTDRGFGLTVGGILLLIAGVRAWLHESFATLELAFGGIAMVLIVLALLAPGSLAGLNRAWTRLGLILFKVVNPIVLGLIYLTTVVPTGLIMRALGRDLLGLKLNPSASTYWVKREPPGPAPDTMTNQF